MRNYIELTRIHKPVGIYLLLAPTMWALAMAGNGHFNIGITIVFIIGVIIMRSFGCVVNDICDRKIDPKVFRTAARPLALGNISVKNAVLFACLLAILATVLLFFLPLAVIPYAIISAIITIIYPLCKRYIQCPQLVLGVAFSMSIPMVYCALNGSVTIQGWQLFFISLIWPIIYDSQYAMADKEDDLKLGVNSSAIWFGNYDYIIVYALQILWLLAWIIFGYYYHLSNVFFLILALLFCISKFQFSLIKTRRPTKCLQAFESNKWVGLLIFVALLYSQSML